MGRQISALDAEAVRAQSLQEAIDKGGFVPLAQAARTTNIPLTTLADAVRQGRIPAVRVQPNRWVVRVSAVELALKGDKALGPSQAQIDQALVEAGLMTIPAGGFKPLTRATPIDFGDGGPTVSQTIIREREERERAIHGH